MDDNAVNAASDDDWLGQVATEMSARAGYTAVVTAAPQGTHYISSEAMPAASIVYVFFSVALTCDNQPNCKSPILDNRTGYDAPIP